MTRNNHFNLVRVLAALAVMVSHSFALANGNLAEQPFASFGVPLGAMAVDVFFVTSGYLVTASLLRRSLMEFTVARLLRIYPALIVAVSVTVLVLGWDFAYWWRNALLFPGSPSTIPGVFEGNAIHGVNASLWTLPYEVRMYAALALLGLLLLRRPIAVKVAAVAIAGVAFGLWITVHSVLAHLAYMFFAGAALQLLEVRFEWRVALVAAAALIASALVPIAFVPMYSIALPVLVLTLANGGGALLAYNRLGDYSYGLYIYAFPVQQSLVALGVRKPWEVFAYSLPVVVALAALSWHLIEKRALTFKQKPRTKSIRGPGLVGSDSA